MKLLASMLAILMLVASMAQATEIKTVTVYDDMGGYMRQYADQGVQWQKDQPLVIFAGACYSACVMYISSEFTFPKCMLKTATFGFHRPFMEKEPTEDQKQFLRDLEQAMWDFYPPRIRDFLTYNGWPSGRDKFSVMTAKDMEGVIPYC